MIEGKIYCVQTKYEGTAEEQFIGDRCSFIYDSHG